MPKIPELPKPKPARIPKLDAPKEEFPELNGPVKIIRKGEE